MFVKQIAKMARTKEEKAYYWKMMDLASNMVQMSKANDVKTSQMRLPLVPLEFNEVNELNSIQSKS